MLASIRFNVQTRHTSEHLLPVVLEDASPGLELLATQEVCHCKSFRLRRTGIYRYLLLLWLLLLFLLLFALLAIASLHLLLLHLLRSHLLLTYLLNVFLYGHAMPRCFLLELRLQLANLLRRWLLHAWGRTLWCRHGVKLAVRLRS